MSTTLYTLLALVAFASNSVLCRIALHGSEIDASTFTSVRLTSGAVMLLSIAAWTRRSSFRLEGKWPAAGVLVLYAVPFSFAYVRLSAGTGALILFGCVQVTMMIAALWSGERPTLRQWLGLGLAILGLVYLVLPGVTAPSPPGTALMAIAGFAWGLYSLLGRGAANPLAQTTGDFVRAVALMLPICALGLRGMHIDSRGALLAIASGAVTSALGYVAWFSALRTLTAMRAAVVQLSVPVLAAIGGVLFLDESVSARLVLSSIVVLGGIGFALAGRPRLAVRPSQSAA